MHLRGDAAGYNEDDPKQSEIIIGTAEQAGAELLHDEMGEPFISFPGQQGGRVNMPVRSRETEDRLRHNYFKAKSKPPANNAVREALDHLAARARFGPPMERTDIRVASREGAVFVDLGDDTNRAVRITAKVWEIVDAPPVRFLRPHGAVGVLPPLEQGFEPERLPAPIGMD